MEKAQRMSWAGWWAVMVNIKEYYTKDLDLILTLLFYLWWEFVQINISEPQSPHLLHGRIRFMRLVTSGGYIRLYENAFQTVSPW